MRISGFFVSYLESFLGGLGGIPQQNSFRFQAHSHNYDTFLFFTQATAPRLKPPSGCVRGNCKGDTKSVAPFLGGVVFDTENENVYIYKNTQKFYGQMSSTNFFKKFEHE